MSESEETKEIIPIIRKNIGLRQDQIEKLNIISKANYGVSISHFIQAAVDDFLKKNNREITKEANKAKDARYRTSRKLIQLFKEEREKAECRDNMRES